MFQMTQQMKSSYDTASIQLLRHYGCIICIVNKINLFWENISLYKNFNYWIGCCDELLIRLRFIDRDSGLINKHLVNLIHFLNFQQFDKPIETFIILIDRFFVF